MTYKQLIDLVTDMKNMSNDERDEAIASMSDGIMVVTRTNLISMK